VAGEIGVSVGTCFTSYSGFRTSDSSGTVQCVALARYLATLGFKLWDLGMGMTYKHKLGATDAPRLLFMAKIRKVRDEPTPPVTSAPFPAVQLFPPAGQPIALQREGPDAPVILSPSKLLPQRDPNSKKSRKREAKKARIAEYKAARAQARGQPPKVARTGVEGEAPVDEIIVAAQEPANEASE
jgi:hypothetical protein